MGGHDIARLHEHLKEAGKEKPALTKYKIMMASSNENIFRGTSL